jgi:NADPH:quinone reductase-like Zn-dependent oxidoreductase
VRAIALERDGRGPRLRELPRPEPRAGELLVSVRASSVNGIDRAIALDGLLTGKEHEFPVVLGHDFAGVVERTASDVGLFEEGDDVFGFVFTPKRDARSGTWADYIVVPQDRFVARKPASLGFVHAGALPLAGVAALTAVDAVEPQPGDPVLVVGATGGVGGFAVEFASERGAHVIATATPLDEARLRNMGASETIDYTVEDVAAEVRARFPDGLRGLIDVVSDAEDFTSLATLLAPGGRAATTLGVANGRINATDVWAAPDPAVLARLARTADTGRLRATIANVYPLEDAPGALAEFSAGTHGKITLFLANGE